MLPGVVMSVLTYRLTATTWKEPEGYVARCSEFGVASAGNSPSEVLINLKEATELYLENVKALGMIDDLEDTVTGRGPCAPRKWSLHPARAEGAAKRVNAGEQDLIPLPHDCLSDSCACCQTADRENCQSVGPANERGERCGLMTSQIQ